MFYEFQRSHDQQDILVIDKFTREIEILSPFKHDKLIMQLISVIRQDFTDAYEALCTQYAGTLHEKFLIARRFIRCNLSISDSVTDFDGVIFSFEDVVCPMRGECKWDGIICRPGYNTTLSPAELDVAKLAAKGCTNIQIADQCGKSLPTVEKQLKVAYKKLGINSRTELVLYIKNNFSEL